MKARLGICLISLLLVSIHAMPTLAQNDDANDKPVALLLFIGGQPQSRVPVPVGQVRLLATAMCEQALEQTGQRTLAQADLDPLREKWRVRTHLGIAPGFLQDVATELGAERLIIVNLISQYDHLLLATRTVECSTGQLLAVALEEADLLPATTADWQTDLQELADRTMAAMTLNLDTPTQAKSGGRLLMLPTKSIATGTEASTAATHLFLRELLTSPHWSLLDPAIVASTLQEAGHHPDRLGQAARRVLISRLGAEWAILPELISYDANSSPKFSGLLDDNEPIRPQSIRDFAITLRMVDLNSGAITAASDLFINTSQYIGWFGQPYRRSLLQQMATSTHELWLTFLADMEAN